MSRRTERVGEQVRAELSRMLREEVTDPRIGFVTLVRVDVSPDLCSALVFWSLVETDGSPSREDTEAGLESAAAFLRRGLAAKLALRRVPALRFRYDPSLELGDQTLSLLRTLRHEPTE